LDDDGGTGNDDDTSDEDDEDDDPGTGSKDAAAAAAAAAAASAASMATAKAEARRKRRHADPSRLPAGQRVFRGTARDPLPVMVPAMSSNTARRLATEAFDRLDWQRRGVVSYETLSAELRLDDDVAEALFERLEFSMTKTLTRRELALVAAQVVKDWSNLGKTLENYSSVTQALRIAVYSVWAVVVLMATLFIFNLSIIEIIVPISTVVVALSFALGEPTRQLVLSVLLLAVYQPYEIGDRVRIDNENQYVHRITLLGTWFRTFHNEMKWIVRPAERAGHGHTPPANPFASALSFAPPPLLPPALRSPTTCWLA